MREYVGTGAVAELSAELDAIARQERDRARAAVRSERSTDRDQEAALIDFCKAIDTVTEEALCAAGYHKHRGQWRRKRDTKEDNNGPGNL